jgi:hypothetical protein
MGPFEGVSLLFNDNLISIAKELNFSESNICILQDNEENIKKTFPEVYKNILSCSHHRDARTPIQYARDLVASWLFEDYIMQVLNKSGINIILSGSDRNREILPNKRVTTESDYLIQFGTNKIHLELMSNYTNFWKKTNKLHLRDAKYKKMSESGAVMLCVSPIDKYFFIIDFRNKINATFIPYHYPYGGKPAYELSIDRFDKHSFEELVLAKAIMKLF